MVTGTVAGVALASAVTLSRWTLPSQDHAVSLERRVTDLEYRERTLEWRLASKAEAAERGSDAREAQERFAPVVVPSPPRDAEPVPEPIAGRGFDVVSLGRGEYLVTRDFLLAPGSGALVGAARVIPHEQDGVVLGLRLFGVRPGSAGARLGLRNGDTAISLNGRSLAETSEVGALLEIVRDSTSLELLVLRRGRLVRLRYSVVG